MTDAPMHDVSLPGGPSGAPVLRDLAPAKVNLSLRVLGRRADGLHRLDSLVAFAAVADELTLAPGGPLSLTVRGPMAAAAGDGPDNLVLRAAEALARRIERPVTGHFHLVKRLPVAAGIGGGSSDAAAALRLLGRANGLAPDDVRLFEAARATGSDVPVCLAPKTRRMGGAGEELSAPLALPRLPAILVNPRVATPTPAVFQALGLARGADLGEPPAALLPQSGTAADLIAALARLCNDLEQPAIAVAPVIRAVIDLAAAQDSCRLARMSGSGATVFALFDSCRASARAARAIRQAQPGWWVATTMIG